jgi:glycosyltransferase involved in cell wall biosynthesis
MKIGIYAPAKNEEKHVAKWYESCKDADHICIADTGSTDNTKELLLDVGVTVHDIRILPWRFDDAFNCAMHLLPADIDVCIRLDLDERLQPGWRAALEKAWTPTTTRLRYEYVWNWNPDGTPGRQWWGDRIHSRVGYRWQGATHEGLYSRLPEVETYSADVKIWQFPDVKTKSGDLSLLLESCKEHPTDSRLQAYLGREYLYRKDYANAVTAYKKFLTMPSNKIERGQAMVNLATADFTNREFWLKMAAQETPSHREPLVGLAMYYLEISNWEKCYNSAKQALSITIHPQDYTCTPEAWGSLPHDLLSVAAWNLGIKDESLEHAKLAVSKNPSDLRLKSNLKKIEESF